MMDQGGWMASPKFLPEQDDHDCHTYSAVKTNSVMWQAFLDIDHICFDVEIQIYTL